MPRVPVVEQQQVQSTGMSGTRIDSGMGPEMAAIAGRQLESMGNALQRGGQETFNLVQQANQVRVDDALNKLRERQLKLTYDKDVGFQGQVGLNALERKSGKSLTEDYDETFQNQMREINDGLGNDMQRASFMAKANEMRVNFNGQTTKHEADQFKEYTLSVREGTIKNRMNEIGLRYDDPAAIDDSVKSIQASVYDQAKLLGKSAEWADAQSKRMTSEAHKVALSAALEKNNIDYAEKYLKKYSGQMEADDLLRVQGLVTKEMDRKQGVQVATDVMRSVTPMLSTNDVDRAFNIALKAESGNRQFDNSGKLIVSKAGAIGAAQVMPTTGPEAAKLAGLKWDEERFKNDPDYNRALGKAYFEKQLQNFGGNIALAYAAYNAGPGAVEEAVKKANSNNRIPNASAANQKSFLDFLPKETQDYVAKNVTAYSSGKGSFERPSLMAVHNQVREKLGPDASSDRLKIALDEATRQYDDFEKARQQKEDDVVANAMREIAQNGGRFNDMSSATRGALFSIAPDQIDKVMSFASRISKGDDTTNLAVYQKLSSSEAYLKSLSDSQFYHLRSELSEADFKHFATERGKLRTGASSDKPEDINSASVKSIVDNRLMGMGIDPTPKDTKKAEIMRVAAIRKTVNDRVLAEQKQRGKRMNDAELEKFVDKLFLETAMTKGGFFSSDKQERMLNMKASDIPKDVRKLIEEDFKARNIEPTDADMLNAYWLLQSKKKGPGATGRW